MIHSVVYHSPIGKIKIEATETVILSIVFVEDENESKNALCIHPILEKAMIQLDEYFKRKRKTFTLPLQLKGTVFQKQVLQEVQQISYGKTCTYKEIAKKINNEKAVRAIGRVVAQNQCLIVIPCHRVIGSNQQLIGYQAGVWRKKWLLQHEQMKSVINRQ